MRACRLPLLVLLLGSAMAFEARAMGMMGHHGMHGGEAGAAARHHYVMRNGLPAEYASRQNPLAPTDENLDAGRAVYERTCASCHGASGRGDGPAAAGLDPPPGNVAAAADRPMASDAYLLWTLAEGGQPLGTAMPPFGDALTDEQIWQVILYLRSL